MLTIEYAQEPVYANEANTIINLMVKFVEMKDALLFTATPDDVMEYGRQLYNNAVSGQYGTIAPYVPVTKRTQTL
jgi:hypothetical protein